jgi:hypothetical protein
VKVAYGGEGSSVATDQSASGSMWVGMVERRSKGAEEDVEATISSREVEEWNERGTCRGRRAEGPAMGGA